METYPVEINDVVKLRMWSQLRLLTDQLRKSLNLINPFVVERLVGYPTALKTICPSVCQSSCISVSVCVFLPLLDSRPLGNYLLVTAELK